MVSEDLLKKLKDLIDGVSKITPPIVLLWYEALKQLAQENEEIKGKVEDMDIIVAEYDFTDLHYKYWLKVGEGEVDYAEGEADDPSVTLKATGLVWDGLWSGRIDFNTAYMSGDLQIAGNIQDATKCGELIGAVMRIIGRELWRRILL